MTKKHVKHNKIQQIFCHQHIRKNILKKQKSVPKKCAKSFNLTHLLNYNHNKTLSVLYSTNEVSITPSIVNTCHIREIFILNIAF